MCRTSRSRLVRKTPHSRNLLRLGMLTGALAASRLFHVCTPGCQAAVDAVYVACEESDRWDPYATSGSQGRRLQSAPSGPTDVQLTVVGNDALGVSWKPPFESGHQG